MRPSSRRISRRVNAANPSGHTPGDAASPLVARARALCSPAAAGRRPSGSRPWRRVPASSRAARVGRSRGAREGAAPRSDPRVPRRRAAASSRGSPPRASRSRRSRRPRESNGLRSARAHPPHRRRCPAPRLIGSCWSRPTTAASTTAIAFVGANDGAIGRGAAARARARAHGSRAALHGLSSSGSRRGRSATAGRRSRAALARQPRASPSAGPRPGT